MASILFQDATDQESKHFNESENHSSTSSHNNDPDEYKYFSPSSPLPNLASLFSGQEGGISEQKPKKKDRDLTEVEMMKQRFVKLLLGEDMSGGGKGVCTALTISNAITNLSATVFGELWRLHPLPLENKKMWLREMEWLLCVSDSIIEFIPSTKEFPDAENHEHEVMEARPRSDLYANLPVLKELDRLLLAILDGFQETEYYYEKKETSVDADVGSRLSSPSSSGKPQVRQEDKWWLPCPKVKPEGLSKGTRKKMEHRRDCVNQILKAVRTINTSVLATMEIPDVYLESLPETGKACLGDAIYHCMTEDKFSPENLLDSLDLSSEYLYLEVANRVEAAIHVWNMKDQKKHSSEKKKRSKLWGVKVKVLGGETERSHYLAQRAESLLESLKLRFPCLPHTTLEANKIQYNTDVGRSILESYSRVLESVAFNIISLIDDLLYVDDMTKQ